MRSVVRECATGGLEVQGLQEEVQIEEEVQGCHNHKAKSQRTQNRGKMESMASWGVFGERAEMRVVDSWPSWGGLVRLLGLWEKVKCRVRVQSAECRVLTAECRMQGADCRVRSILKWPLGYQTGPWRFKISVERVGISGPP